MLCSFVYGKVLRLDGSSPVLVNLIKQTDILLHLQPVLLHNLPLLQTTPHVTPHLPQQRRENYTNDDACDQQLAHLCRQHFQILRQLKQHQHELPDPANMNATLAACSVVNPNPDPELKIIPVFTATKLIQRYMQRRLGREYS